MLIVDTSSGSVYSWSFTEDGESEFISSDPEEVAIAFYFLFRLPRNKDIAGFSLPEVHSLCLYILDISYLSPIVPRCH